MTIRMLSVFAVLCALCFAAAAQEPTAYDRAFDLYSQGKYKEAEAEYRKALDECPDSVGANLELGRMLRELDRVDEALPFLQTATELAPSLAAAAFELGMALVVKQDWPKAEEALSKAVKLEPKDPYAWWQLGAVYLRQDDLGRAEKSLLRAVGLDEELSVAWLDLGEVYRKKGDGAKALTAARAAFETDPTSGPAFEAFAAVVRESGSEDQKAYVEAFAAHNGEKFGDAERAVRALMEKDAANARYPALLGHVMLHQTPPKAKEAAEGYEAALELDKKASRNDRFPVGLRSCLLEGLGIACLLLDDLKKARETFTLGVRTDEEAPNHYYYLAVVAARDGKLPDLFKNLVKVRERDFDGSWVRRARDDDEFKAFRERKEFFEALEGGR